MTLELGGRHARLTHTSFRCSVIYNSPGTGWTRWHTLFAAPEQNRLLAALPTAERERIFPHLEFLPMPLGGVLYEPDDVLQHVYFPTDCIVSLLYVMADGASAEIAVVGNEVPHVAC